MDRGATFLIIGASITRQFEFLQRVWVNDGDLIGLGTKKDPLSGANDGTGIFTIPRKPLRRRVKGLPRLVTTRAGEDCFLPRHPGAAMDSRRPARGPAQYPTESDPVRLEEDAGFLPRRDGSDQPRCYGAAGARDIASGSGVE